jgi:hypothetical protein
MRVVILNEAMIESEEQDIYTNNPVRMLGHYLNSE